MIYQDKKGIALLITLILLGTVIATALSVSILITGQTQITRAVDDSVLALFAADAGIEKMFYACSGKIASPPDGSASFSNNDLGNVAKYQVCMATDGVCTNSCNDIEVISSGQYGSTKRSFQAAY